MSFERTFQGAWKVTAFVSDGWGGAWLHAEQFMGYTKRESAAMFRRSVREHGWSFA